MSLADIFKRKPKQLDADPEDGDGSEMMAGNEAVRKKQILLMSGGAAIALVLGSWYIMDDDKAELVTEQYQPVIEMPTGINVEIVFLEGVFIQN